MIIPYICLALLMLWLQTRFFWVEAGTFVIKKRAWRRGESKYVALGAGRHYILPLIESIVKGREGKVLLIPTDRDSPHTLEPSEYGNADLKFLLSISYQFRISDSKAFINYLYSSSPNPSEWSIVPTIDSEIKKITNGICDPIRITDFSTISDIKDQLRAKIVAGCSNLKKSMHCEISDFKLDRCMLMLNLDQKEIVDQICKKRIGENKRK